jgi:hypothetical protein
VSAREELIATNTPMGLLMAKLDEMGGVDYVTWMLSGWTWKHKWRVFANKLFQGAPPTATISLEANLEDYNFHIGNFITPWMSSIDLGVKFYKGAKGKEIYSESQVKDWGSFDFSIRVGIQLDQEIAKASLLTLALPVAMGNLEDYNRFVDAGKHYPTMCLHESKLRLGPLSSRKIGLPITLYYVWSETTPVPDFSPEGVWRVVRKFMNEAPHMTVIRTLMLFASTVLPEEGPEINENEVQLWTWPPFSEEEEEEDLQVDGQGSEEDEEEDEGNACNNQEANAILILGKNTLGIA